VVAHWSAQATTVLLPGLLMRPDLHSLLPLLETPKQEVHSDRHSLAAFA
jgi:hypothetical protein